MALCTKIYWTTLQVFPIVLEIVIQHFYDDYDHLMLHHNSGSSFSFVNSSWFGRFLSDASWGEFSRVPWGIGGLEEAIRISPSWPTETPAVDPLRSSCALHCLPPWFFPHNCYMPSESKWRQVRIASAGGSRRTEIQVEIPGTYEHMGRMCCRENKAKASTAMNCHNLESNS